jgi:hypothetical protein
LLSCAKSAKKFNTIVLKGGSRNHIIALVLILAITTGVFAFAFNQINQVPQAEPDYGLTFSIVYAEQLGLDYQEVYKALVEDLGVSRVRLPIYWSEVESDPRNSNWEVYDWLFEYSENHNVELIPVVGSKVPRWPECFIPYWVEKLNTTYQHKELLKFMKYSVERYKDSESVIRWQVENEPFFPFGECPTVSSEQFQQRVELVRSLDDKPIQVTVSGEVGPWLDSAQAADVLGISMYRQTWNDLFGYFVYPISPEFYFFRAGLVAPYVDKVIVSELQAEPWFPEAIENRTPAKWYESFTAEMFQNNLDFAIQSGLSEAYLWGAEWWYFLLLNGEDRLWEKAKEINW